LHQNTPVAQRIHDSISSFLPQYNPTFYIPNKYLSVILEHFLKSD